MGVHRCAWGIGAGMWGLESKSRVGTALRKQPEGAGMRSSKTRSARGRSLDGCTKYHCLVMHKGGAATAASPLAHQPLQLQALPETACAPLSSPLPPLPPPGWSTHPNHCLMGFHFPVAIPAPSCLGGPLTPITTSVPSGLMGLCAQATSRADCDRRNTHRGGAETTAEPKGPCD